MPKRNTVELDDPEEIIDDTPDNIVDEELEKFERESQEATSRDASFAGASRHSGRDAATVAQTTANVEKQLVSRQTQTETVAAPTLRLPTSKAGSLQRGASSAQLIQGVNTVRTLTRQLRTGGRRATLKKINIPKTIVVEEPEEEEDDFYKMEAGNSNNRKQGTLKANLDPGPSDKDIGSKRAKPGLFRSFNKSLSRTFTVSRLRTTKKQDTRERVRRDNVRAKLGWFKLLLHDLKLAIDRQKQERNEFKLFLKTIKAIQGELGSSTAALFLFVRYLLMINLVSAVIWVGFVVVPQALNFDYSDSDEPYFVTLTLFLGTGKVAESWLFFQGYSESFGRYPMYVTYILAHFVAIVAVFFGILKTIGNDVVREGSDSGYQEKSLAMNLFGGWDYSINSHDAIKKQEKSTRSNFKDLLCELTSSQMERTVNEMRKIYALRSLAWFIWLLLVSGAITAIVIVVTFSSDNSGSTDALVVYGPTVALTAINSAVPFLMQKLTLIESYDIGRTEQYVTIARVYVMRMISLCTFIITLIKDSDSETCPQLAWGQEFYKLVIINTFTNTATLLKYPAFLYLLDKRTEVDLPSSLMSLIYFQGCIWFGNLFCPLLSSMAVIANLLYFSIGSVLIKKCCQPPTKRYNSQNSKFFNTFLAITIVIMMILTSYIIIQQEVACGPYTSTKYNTMFDAFSEFSKDWPTNVTTVISVIASAAVAVPLVFLLGVMIWFLNIVNSKTTLKNEIMAGELLILRQEKANFLKEKRNSPVPLK